MLGHFSSHSTLMQSAMLCRAISEALSSSLDQCPISSAADVCWQRRSEAGGTESSAPSPSSLKLFSTCCHEFTSTCKKKKEKNLGFFTVSPICLNVTSFHQIFDLTNAFFSFTFLAGLLNSTSTHQCHLVVNTCTMQVKVHKQ